MTYATLKTYKIGQWTLKAELAANEHRQAELELEMAKCQERAAVIRRQLPEYERMIAKFTPDPRDDITPFELQADDADAGAYDGAA